LVRASLDTLEFARLVVRLRPDTVVHLQTLDRTAELGRARAREGMVLGAQALFGAIARCGTVRTVIVKSDAAVYGAGPRHPSVLTETTTLPEHHSTRYERSLREVERFVSEMRDELPDVRFTLLRFVGIFGDQVGNAISRYLRLQVVPMIFGFDPRLQLIHEEDAVRVIEHALAHPTPGIFNVAADGQLYLSRILRLGRRLHQPLPGTQFERALRLLRSRDLVVPSHLSALLRFGRILDTSAMRERLEFTPLLTCRQTILAGYGLLAPALGA
jgi:UDP-glucose 4-epimerase